MTQEQLNTLFKLIKATPDNGSNELATTVLQIAADSITLETLKTMAGNGLQLTQGKEEPAKLPSKGKKENDREQTFGVLNFSTKELSTMPKAFQKSFIVDNRIVKFRFYEGLFQARYRRDGFHIEVASKDFDTMKQKFMLRLSMQAENPEAVVTGKRTSQKGKIPTSVILMFVISGAYFLIEWLTSLFTGLGMF